MPDTSIFAAFSIFDTRTLPETSLLAASQNYGSSEVQIIIQQYYKGDSSGILDSDPDTVLEEWHSYVFKLPKLVHERCLKPTY